jgi:hypothetical protein
MKSKQTNFVNLFNVFHLQEIEATSHEAISPKPIQKAVCKPLTHLCETTLALLSFLLM